MAIPFTAELIKELRLKTGADLAEIKEALQESEGDTDAAVDWLRVHGTGGESLKNFKADYGETGRFTITLDTVAEITQVMDELMANDEIDDDIVSAGSIKVPDVKSLRTDMGLSQSAFAQKFGLSLTALQNWEQRRRTPDKSARILIRLIAANPDLVAEVAAQEP